MRVRARLTTVTDAHRPTCPSTTPKRIETSHEPAQHDPPRADDHDHVRDSSSNLVIPETIVKLYEVVAGLEADPDIQGVIFTSELPDFFINHFGGSTAGDLPAPEHEGGNPVWTDRSCG